MGNRAFWWRSAAILGLLVGVGGCEDRLRPTFGAVGNGIGPLSFVMAPAELDAVTRGVAFSIAVRVEDEDGVDSVWVVPSDTLMTDWRFGGSGDTAVTASLGNFIVSNAYLSDTLTISVYGVDLLGDTGVAYIRHLLVQ